MLYLSFKRYSALAYVKILKLEYLPNLLYFSSQHVVSGYYRPARETPLKACFASGPIVGLFDMRMYRLFETLLGAYYAIHIGTFHMDS